MNNISISQLKVNPSKFIDLAGDYPVAVEKRNKIQAYLVGKNLFEKIVDYLENKIDQIAIAQKIRSLEEEKKLLTAEKLQGYKNTYRIRIGNYRIVYRKFSNR